MPGRAIGMLYVGKSGETDRGPPPSTSASDAASVTQVPSSPEQEELKELEKNLAAQEAVDAVEPTKSR